MITVQVSGVEGMQSRIGRAIDGLDPSVETGMLQVGNIATAAMEQAIMDAHTPTGEARVESGYGPYAGRIETEVMIRSLRQSDGTPGNIRSSGGDIEYEVGYVNNPPKYTVEQEWETYSGSTLNALQGAYSVLVDDGPVIIQGSVNDMVRETEKGTYRKPANTYQVWSG